MAPQLRALPGLLQALAPLPLHHAAISARVDRALAENPALRRKAGTPCPGCGRHRRAGPCPECSGTGPRLTAEPAVDPFAELDRLAATFSPQEQAAITRYLNGAAERVRAHADELARS